MAVTSVAEQLGTFDGTREYNGPDGAALQYKVKTDSKMTSLEVIDDAQDHGLPSFGDVLYTGSLLVARRFSAFEEAYNQWVVSVEYRPRDPLETEDEDPPDERPATYSWSYVEYQETREQDAEGNAYVNSAGDPIDKPPTFILPGLVLTVKQYQAAFDPTFYMDFVGTTNKGIFFNAPEDTLKFKPASATREYVDGAFYYAVTFQFEYRPDQWQPVDVLDQGPRVLENGSVVAATDANGVVTGKSVLLDDAGAAVAVGGEPHFLQFRPFRQMNYDALGLRLV